MQFSIDNNDCINKYDYKNGTGNELLFFVGEWIKGKFEGKAKYSPKTFLELKKDIENIVLKYTQKLIDEN